MSAIRGGIQNGVARAPRTEFRTSFTQPQGLGKTDVILGRVVNIDLVNYTVDVFSQFDQMRIFSVQVGSGYMHANRGDGFGSMPEVGAKCAVCWPGDGSPPFVFSFVMPHETIPDAADEEAPAGTQSRGSDTQPPANASFAGGRPRAKPGDMWLRGRDGNFVVLHRGGVLQIGANELAQRMFIPLDNLVMDFAEKYALHNAGGSIRWGIQEGEGTENLPAEYTQTFRVYANEKFADIRIAAGRVHNAVPETDRDAITDQGALGVGKTEPIVYEVTLAKNGFKAEDGALETSTANLVKFRFFFDRTGNTFLRVDGNVGALCKKRLRLRVKQEMEIFADSSFTLNVKGEARVSVGGTFEIVAPVVKINSGSAPVAFVGCTVSVPLPPTLLAVSPSPSGFAPIGSNPLLMTAIGTITQGRSDILV